MPLARPSCSNETADHFLSFGLVLDGAGAARSSLVAAIAGPHALHFGMECRKELIEHSRVRLDELGHTNVQLVHANCFALDPEQSMRFQRIYVGAGAAQHSASMLFRMLEIGGIIVGPFSSARGNQRMLRVKRIGEAVAVGVRAARSERRVRIEWTRRDGDLEVVGESVRVGIASRGQGGHSALRDQERLERIGDPIAVGARRGVRVRGGAAASEGRVATQAVGR